MVSPRGAAALHAEGNLYLMEDLTLPELEFVGEFEAASDLSLDRAFVTDQVGY